MGAAIHCHWRKGYINHFRLLQLAPLRQLHHYHNVLYHHTFITVYQPHCLKISIKIYHGVHMLPASCFWYVVAEEFLLSQGAIFSAIGGAINAVISAIADVLMIIVGVIVTVSLHRRSFSPHVNIRLTGNFTILKQIIVTIFDVIFDILCCNCFGGRTRRTGTHSYRFGRGGLGAGAGATY